MTMKKCAEKEGYKKPKDAKFECKKCGRKSLKSDEVCKPKKIEK